MDKPGKLENIKEIKAGIIGMSEGNGHPYSWSAICNGYDTQEMMKSPFPVIPHYLEKERWPEAQLKGLSVTHIWTQSRSISEAISKAAFIPNISHSVEDLVKEVDVVLLARDDAENHYKYALPAIQAGKPIFIDKPFALNVREAERLWNAQVNDNQIFTCSALQFSIELQPNKIDRNKIGKPKIVWATTPKTWDKYAVHLIEPILRMFPDRGSLVSVKSIHEATAEVKAVEIQWSEDFRAYLYITGSIPSPIWFRVLGDKGFQDLYFTDTFSAFKNALKKFKNIVNNVEKNIPKEFTLEMVKIVEEGKKNA